MRVPGMITSGWGVGLGRFFGTIACMSRFCIECSCRYMYVFLASEARALVVANLYFLRLNSSPITSVLSWFRRATVQGGALGKRKRC